MRATIGLFVLLTCIVVGLAVRPTAQDQPPAPPGAAAQGQQPGGGRAAPPPPQNLKVLPKNWTRQQVQALMQTFVVSLGQQPPAPGSPAPPQGQGEGCLHCHARPAPDAAVPPGARGPQVDYASDANPNKDIARKMIQMVMAANDGFLKDMGDKAVPEKVSCFTCHRGDATAKPPMQPANGWGRGGFSLLPAGPPLPAGRGGL